ncbi:DNA polymerase II [bacterium]|nr:MAG: DNA polymerase II [bacterium]
MKENTKVTADVSREVAESARQTEWQLPSFAGGLFMGNFDASPMLPYTDLPEAERKATDEFCKKLDDYLVNNYDADEVDRTGKIPPHHIEHLKKMGLFNMKIPKEYGGLGFSQLAFTKAAMVVASHCGSLTAWMSAHQSIGVPQPLKYFGTKEQKDKYFPMMANGALSAFALTEPDVGSDPARLATTAELTEDGKHWIINGDKLWTTNGVIAELLVVMARTVHPETGKKGITAFIVETNTPGFEVIHRCEFMGIRAIENGLLRFTNVKVPFDAVIGGINKGLKLALATLNTGRLTLPAASAGGGKLATRIVRKWAQDRAQWGQVIGKHDAVSGQIAYIASHTFAIEAIALVVSQMADQGKADIRIEAAMAKLFTTEHGWNLLDKMIQVRGGRGYETAISLSERGEMGYPAERMLRDMRINRILEGSTEIMHLFLAREALDVHLKKGGDLLNPKVSIGKKLVALMKAGAFYAPWYISRYIPTVPGSSFAKEPAQLHKYYKYVGKTSKVLARTIFHKMNKYVAALEFKQRILGRIVDIGTDLFSIAATAAYAGFMLKENPNDKSVLSVVETYFTFAKQRIEQNFAELDKNFDSEQRKFGIDIIDDKLTWLEDGAISEASTRKPNFDKINKKTAKTEAVAEPD